MTEHTPDNVCEERTFRELFSNLSTPIRNFLVYKGSDLERAEDIVQESFVKLWENCKKVLPEKAKSYLYTIAGNAFKNEMAHLKVRLKYATHQAGSGKTIETPEFQMEEKQFREKLEGAIGSLPETQREVFLMNRIEKKKYSEIADLLGVSVKAIEKRMGKALKHLRIQIKEFR